MKGIILFGFFLLSTVIMGCGSKHYIMKECRIIGDGNYRCEKPR